MSNLKADNILLQVHYSLEQLCCPASPGPVKPEHGPLLAGVEPAREKGEAPDAPPKKFRYALDGSGFKGDVPGGDKDVAFRLPCDPALDWVAVFEAPIDLMSFCTLHRAVTSNAVALCGLYQGPLDIYLRENPHLKQILLCLDADKWGQRAAEKFQKEYSQKGYTVSTRTPAYGKDWNEYLQQRGRVGERRDQRQAIAR